MQKNSFSVNCCIVIGLLLVNLSFPVISKAQFSDFIQKAKKVKEAAKAAEEAARAARETARELTNTSKEVNNTVKSFKQTWKRDTARNIRYQQIPDYRNRDEVAISKKQKLSIENGEFVNLSWTPLTKFDNQIFPSFIISWANYQGDKNEDMGSCLGFRINTSLSSIVLKWEIEAADKSYFTIDSGYINCDDLKNSGKFLPKIAWNFRNLTKQETSAPLNVYFRLIEPNTGKKIEKLERVNIRSINDCMTYYDGVSYKNMFVAFANEDHPEIDKILKEALDTKMITSISGYQAYGAKRPLSEEEYNEAKKKVDLQVAAIWKVLHNRGFQYSSISDNSGDNSGKLFAQTVRTFDNSMKTSQANCVDGTVVFASILKRIGLKPKLVLVPGHCFLAYNNDEDISDNMTFIETTLLSNATYLSKDSVVKYRKDFIIPYYPKSALKTATESNLEFFLQYYLARVSGTRSFYKKENEGKITLIDLCEERKKLAPIPVYSN